MNSKFDRYNQYAKSTVYSEPEAGNFHNDLIRRAVAEIFMPLKLPTNAQILDAGCGPGVFMDVLAEAGYINVHGVTLSPDDIEVCRSKGFTVHDCDISDLFSPNGALDVVWCRHAIEHSPFPFFTLLEFNRVLKVGGLAYIEVPAPALMRRHEENPNHYSILGKEMWQALFTRAGFEMVGSWELGLTLNIGEQAVPELFYAWVIKKCTSIPNEN